jgi:5-methylcytosine-specific restriction endonuclease McrA
MIFIDMRKRKYTKESLLPFVEQSKSYAELLSKLELKQNGGNHRLITMRVKEYGINTSHFTGQLWNKGKNRDNDVRVRNQSLKIRTPECEVFCENSGYKSSKLYNRLVELGWKEECSICKIVDWMGKPIRFHVDHKNGNHSDNRLDNLRIICPNCHQQTETWGPRSKKACRF